MNTAAEVPEERTEKIEGDAWYAQLVADAIAASSVVGTLPTLVRAV
jgi:hypothetical protein